MSDTLLKLIRMEPQPPKGIRYMSGNEPWLPKEDRSPLRLVVEEWGNMGPLELDSTIKTNGAGFRVKITEILAPDGTVDYKCLDGEWVWRVKELEAQR